MTQTCPICARGVESSARYPRYVCRDCAARAADHGGQALTFSNESISGGYEARYAATGEIYPSHECWIDGVLCSADEARFGGIVIEAAD